MHILSKPQFTIWVMECGMITNCGLDSMHGVCVCVCAYICMHVVCRQDLLKVPVFCLRVLLLQICSVDPCLTVLSITVVLLPQVLNLDPLGGSGSAQLLASIAH